MYVISYVHAKTEKTHTRSKKNKKKNRGKERRMISGDEHV